MPSHRQAAPFLLFFLIFFKDYYYYLKRDDKLVKFYDVGFEGYLQGDNSYEGAVKC